MATNLALDDKLIVEAKKMGKHKTKREAVMAALEEYVKRRKQARIGERCSICKWVHPWTVKSKERAVVCPSMKKYLYDAYSAQGRFDLARALLEGEIELTPKVLEVIYTCTLCGACDVICKFSRDMEPLDVLHELRTLAVKEGKGPLPGHMPAVESIQKNSNPWLQPRARRAHWARKLGLKDLNKEKAEVLYFAGCTFSYNASAAGCSVDRSHYAGRGDGCGHTGHG